MKDLPPSLVAALESDEPLRLPARFPDGHGNDPVTFHQLAEVRLIQLYVDASEYIENYGELEKTLDEMYFPFSAYDLLSDVPGYNPVGTLIWLPTIEQFGSCDTDHGVLYSFPTITWPQIVASPEGYINCQWYPERVANELIRPWRDERFANSVPTTEPN